ncbi:MAG: 4Fe-4S dicluster domain-containing protein [Desulfovibrionaceae bacterium]
MATYRIKFDKKRCIACHACLVHCKQKNRVPDGLSLNKLFAELEEKKGKPVLKVKYQPCLMCKKPECVPACPTGAMQKRESDGLVFIVEELCNGCGECVTACPWNVPVMDEVRGKAIKCDYCMDRIAEGRDPACVTGCTAQALTLVRPE